MQDQRIRGQRWQPPSDELVLAAVDRAYRHRPTLDYGDPPASAVADHLGITWNAHASRRLRPILARLSDERGWLRRSRVRGRDRWALTEAGSRRLAQAAVDGVVDELPESPQHRQWRTAREHAAVRLAELQDELSELLARVNAMLEAPEPAAAADWLSCVQPLRDLTEAIGVATYCLHERPEPHDPTADRDERIEPHGSRSSWRHPRAWDPGHGE